jgi:hypothetical protein
MKLGALLLVVIMLVSVSAWALTPGGGPRCHYTPGYWKNHEEVWPTTTISFGGISYDQAQLLGILRQPVRGDATIILAHHLIAAYLNVDRGAEMPPMSAIAEANNLLGMYPIGSNPPDPARQMILDVKDILCAYNEMRVPNCY